ncbi:MAG TPA: ABC transporter permease subunit [Vicinamibacteria bacterium]|nr:ABC transporter permease subunit [Vicinamibacteria bacterium]
MASVREQIQAASRRIAWLKRLDRAAAVVITMGGIAVVASVMGILLFIVGEAWPLFRAAEGRHVGAVQLAAPPPTTLPPSLAASPAPALPAAVEGASPLPSPPPSPPPLLPPSPAPPPTALLALGTDEYQRYLYVVRADARVALHRMEDGAWVRDFPLAAVAGAAITAASRSLEGDLVAAGTADGRVALAQVAFQPRYEAQRLVDLDVSLADRGLLDLDPARRPVTRVDYTEGPSGERTVAAVLADDEVAVVLTDPSGTERRATLRIPTGERITALALGRTDRLVAGTDRGQVYHWSLSEEPPRLTSVSPVGSAPITALAWAIGAVTFVAGSEDGRVSAWFATRLRDDDEEPVMVRAHDFAPAGGAVRAIAASTRDKSFATVGGDGTVTYRFLTNERTLLTLQGADRGAISLTVTPKGDGILVGQQDGTLARFAVDVPHPEITWRALFGKVWYEGYGEPEYVWQSTGATNDFETKFSLVPLVFGTLKGTFYALLFAIPIAVLGALYTSQFVHPSVRAKVKPTVEIMAALPSVVIGFVAGLYLAPLVERIVVPVLLMFLLLPLFGTAGVFVWRYLPVRVAKKLRPGMELCLIVPMMLLAGWVALQAGPHVERWLFSGDFRLWVSSALGVTYDQRNSLVVGLAMGFAVIPIIFTIADDAFSSVPSSLTAGSLALGASRWQTAMSVVLPTASPGVFSAVMVGFGRAVGETMIVLMATGNTPVMDWSIFNGMRTLSANIAVEIPEAPHGGTLYRVLFLAAALLFAMTFLVNTIAEVIRQRLRERYRAL